MDCNPFEDAFRSWTSSGPLETSVSSASSSLRPEPQDHPSSSPSIPARVTIWAKSQAHQVPLLAPSPRKAQLGPVHSPAQLPHDVPQFPPSPMLTFQGNGDLGHMPPLALSFPSLPGNFSRSQYSPPPSPPPQQELPPYHAARGSAGRASSSLGSVRTSSDYSDTSSSRGHLMSPTSLYPLDAHSDPCHGGACGESSSIHRFPSLRGVEHDMQHTYDFVDKVSHSQVSQDAGHHVNMPIPVVVVHGDESEMRSQHPNKPKRRETMSDATDKTASAVNSTNNVLQDVQSDGVQIPAVLQQVGDMSVQSLRTYFEEQRFSELLRLLDDVARIHPFVSVAVVAFKVAFQTYLTRKDNDARVVKVYTVMRDMMMVLRELLEADDASPTHGQLEELCQVTANDIKTCAKLCDTYHELGSFEKFTKARAWKSDLTYYETLFSNRRKEFVLAIAVRNYSKISNMSAVILARDATFKEALTSANDQLQVDLKQHMSGVVENSSEETRRQLHAIMIKVENISSKVNHLVKFDLPITSA
ncbi:hypothetical protein EIP91_008741 [Steccherinum ochraceum]|uniref:Uncharacterized protein n=1 Tax=Steccherinum ochraceum TaxID=92696 RepID=A0A4R0RTW0_9APHY|nr:hypothetical protein EIP91_008741 [Steccherinum ochraceum]